MKSIVDEPWKYLIVLDTCRYDYFKDNYSDFLEGDLSCIRSNGTCTTQWRDNSFPDKYDDIVYISANPNFSANQSVYGYNAGEHFHKVYELWNTEWDIYRGTVLPESMTRKALEISRQHPDKRFVLHFQQPHEPYLMPGILSYGYDQANINSDRKLITAKRYRFLKHKTKLLRFLLKYFKDRKFFISPSEWALRQLLFMPPRCAMDAVRRKYGKKVLRKAYEENLRYALAQVKILSQQLEGEIIVTSDHGEFLGEDGMYGHPKSSENPILRNVPWLVVSKSSGVDTNRDNDDNVKSKLRALGYFDE